MSPPQGQRTGKFEVLNSGVAEDSRLLGCYTVLLGNELLAF